MYSTSYLKYVETVIDKQKIPLNKILVNMDSGYSILLVFTYGKWE